MLKALVPSAILLITPLDTAFFGEESCLNKGFYGSFGGQSIFKVDTACFETNVAFPASGQVIPALQPLQQLVWVEADAVDETLLKREPASLVSPLDQLLSHLTASDGSDSSLLADAQSYLAPSKLARPVEVLHRTQSSALLSMHPDVARTIDTILPRFYKSILLPNAPIGFAPVPEGKVHQIQELLASLKFSPKIANIVNSISVNQMKRDVRYLTGEDEDSPIISRHSFAAGSREAANWLVERFDETGAKCELRPFRAGFAPNVICRYPSTVNTTATVLLSAHYDSRGSFGSIRAPGGDDDGSGVMALLGIAHTIKRKGVRFRSNVELVAFAGEEQGLLVSRAYSEELRAADANLTLMIQADMLAYHAPGEPAQLGLPEFIGTPEVAQLVSNISALYSPELKVGFTAACCSDHQSFHQQGFAATQVFERAGPIADPMYHNSGDLSDRENYDFEQVKSIAKVQFATLLHAAGYDLPKKAD